MFRRYFHPLLLRIHPDLFSQAVPAVKVVNTLCLQRINDLGDAVERLHNGTRVLYPLDSIYTFHCFVRPPVVDDSDVALREVRVEVRVPTRLTKAHALDACEYQSALNNLGLEFQPLFEGAGIMSPWVARREPVVERSGGKVDTLSGLHEEAHKRAAARLAELHMRASVRSAFKHDGFGGGTATVACEVDLYLRFGGVLVDRSLSATDEHTALRKLRQFLIDYEAIVGFEASSWARVVFVLDGEARYACEQRNGRYFVRAPHKFKSGRLLDLIGKNIPTSQFQS
jgi:hypothetical protein